MGESIKGSYLYRKGKGVKDREEGRQGMGKERGGDGPLAGGCFKVLGDRRPCMQSIFSTLNELN